MPKTLSLIFLILITSELLQASLLFGTVVKGGAEEPFVEPSYLGKTSNLTFLIISSSLNGVTHTVTETF